MSFAAPPYKKNFVLCNFADFAAGRALLSPQIRQTGGPVEFRSRRTVALSPRSLAYWPHSCGESMQTAHRQQHYN
jgi:hypothetical protein